MPVAHSFASPAARPRARPYPLSRGRAWRGAAGGSDSGASAGGAATMAFERYGVRDRSRPTAIRWTRLSCRAFAASAVRLQLHALACNLGNFLRALATPEPIKDWSPASLKEELIKIGAKVVSHGRHVALQIAEVAVPRNLLADILRLNAELRPPSLPSTA